MYFWKHNKYCDAPLALLTSCHGSSTRNLNNLAKFWCAHLGHPGIDTLKQILTSCNISNDYHRHNICCVCQYAKSHRLLHPLFESRASHPLALVHTDL